MSASSVSQHTGSQRSQEDLVIVSLSIKNRQDLIHAWLHQSQSVFHEMCHFKTVHSSPMAKVGSAEDKIASQASLQAL